MQTKWVSGLTCSKRDGQGQKHMLYVADVDAVAVIDIKQGKIVNRINVGWRTRIE
jgi:hypothetical protein